MNARCCMPPERSAAAFRAVGEPDPRDCLAHGSADRRRATAPRARRKPAGGDELAHRRRGLPARIGPLGEVAEQPPAAELVRRLAVEQYAARRRPLQFEEEPEEGRLAAAVRPGDGHELALLDAEVDVLEHRLLGPVAEADAVELDRYRHPRATRSVARLRRITEK